MVGLSEVDDLDEEVLADHDVMTGKVHMHDLLLFQVVESVSQVDEDMHFGL